MAAAIAPGGGYASRADPLPTRCAECQSVLVDALVMVCGHDLCLACAGAAHRNTTSLKGRTVACGVCRERTELCEEAAASLTTIPAQAIADSAYGVLDRHQQDGSFSRGEWGAALRGGRPAQAKFGAQDLGGPVHRAASSSSPFQASGGLQAPSALRGGGQEPCGVSSAASASGFGSPRRYSDGRVDAARGALEPGSGAGYSGHRQRELGYGDSLPSRPPSAQGQPPLTPHGRVFHITRCPDHPEEQATYFCATCECPCICAECVVQKNGRHYDHDVMRIGHAHEKLRARAGMLLDEALALEDEFAMVADRLVWRRKDIERAAARGRASVRSAFERVRAQLNDREAELLESLEVYETDNLGRIDTGYSEQASHLEELRRLQANLRSRCRSGEDAVEALNTYATAKRAIASISTAFRNCDVVTEAPEEFVGLAGAARTELDMHAEGLASLEEAVQRLCSSGARGRSEGAGAEELRRGGAASDAGGGPPTPQGARRAGSRKAAPPYRAAELMTGDAALPGGVGGHSGR